MKKIIFILSVIITLQVKAQQAIDSKKMNYIINLRPNNILYHDTLYRGAAAYKDLFYRTGDNELMVLYQKHQSNKIIGGIASVVGAFTTGFGVAYATSNNNTYKSSGWIVAGSGFVCTIVGGYLTLVSQQSMMKAVNLFNSKYNKATVSVGFTANGGGIALNF